MNALTRLTRNAALSVLGATMLCAPLAAQTLRIGLQEDPDILDPHEARTFVGRIVFQSLCEKLVDVDAQLKFVPRLATSWSFSDDGKTMTMKLRAGAKFHDGTAIDAAAIKANIERAKTLQTSRRKSELTSVERVDVVDPLTVAFRLKAPDAPLLAQLSDRAGMMLSPASFGQPVGAKPICSGPYKFVERVQNDRIVLEKFAGHWEQDRYGFERVVFRMIPDTTVRLANLRSGQLDLLERLAPSDVKSAKADASLAVASAVGLGYQGLTINVGNGDMAKTPMGQDRRVREALSLAIDREAISQVVFEGLYPPAIQPFPPASPYFDKDFPVPKRDLAKAKALLAAAGHPKFSFELMVANNPVQQQLAQVIQAMAAEAGFDIKIRAMEFASQLKDQSAGKYQVSQIGWSGRVDPDGNIHQFVTTGGGINDAKYSHPKVDAELNAARQVYDPAKRKAHYDAAEVQLRTDLPLLYLYYQPWIWAMSSKLQGFTPSPDGMIRLGGVKLAK